MGNSSREPYARGTIRDNKIKSQKPENQAFAEFKYLKNQLYGNANTES